MGGNSTYAMLRFLFFMTFPQIMEWTDAVIVDEEGTLFIANVIRQTMKDRRVTE